MSVPKDIEQFIANQHPCPEGVERLLEHASMKAAWEASTHGPFLAYIVKVMGLGTPAVKAVNDHHLPLVKAAAREARALPNPNGQRQQDLHQPYWQALAKHATALKEVVPNPFV
jgi:hypothetical protein